jgi:hypothetical protein
VGLDEHRCSGDLGLFEDHASATVQHTRDAADSGLRTLDLHQIDLEISKLETIKIVEK